ncbi:MAG: hypothetical protein EAX95_07820 [Candidatus Thorarchaeota archaeon]|nr:hypothetical protein [Candidatus Thorarchaeota archaeon]
MLYETVTNEPRIANADYMEIFQDPLIPDEDNSWTAMVYRGTGVSIDEHPLRDRLGMRGCKNCGSEEVKVIYAQWSVSTASGDAYWDYEIVCSNCGMFTARSFSEND